MIIATTGREAAEWGNLEIPVGAAAGHKHAGGQSEQRLRAAATAADGTHAHGGAEPGSVKAAQ